MNKIFVDTSYFIALYNQKDEFQVMTEQKITDALTADPHFKQYGFNVLLKHN